MNYDHITGDLVSNLINTPLDPDDPRLAAMPRPAVMDEAERPRPVTFIGNNGPASSRPRLDRELTPAEVERIESEVAARRRKSAESDDNRYESLLIGPKLTPRQRRGDFGFGPAVKG
jgi:hypothetical protein